MGADRAVRNRPLRALWPARACVAAGGRGDSGVVDAAGAARALARTGPAVPGAGPGGAVGPGQCLAFRLPAVRRIRLAGLQPLLFATHLLSLRRLAPLLPAKALSVAHVLGCWLLLGVLALELRYLFALLAEQYNAWRWLGWALVPSAYLLLVAGGRSLPWPLRDFRGSIGCSPLRRWRCCCSAGSGAPTCSATALPSRCLTCRWPTRWNWGC